MSFIRWNSSTHIWERDTSAPQDGSGPWIALELNASILNEGTLDNNRLSAVPYSKLSLSNSIVNADIAAAAAIAWSKISKSGSSLLDLATRSASDLNSGNVATSILGTGSANNRNFLRGDLAWTNALGSTRYQQQFVNLSTTPQDVTGVILAKRISLITVTAPSTDAANFITLSGGGAGIAWVIGYLGSGGFTASNTLSFTMAGTGAEDYTLSVTGGAGQLSIKKTAAGTLTGSTDVTVHVVTF